MTNKVSATLDPSAEAALKATMRRNGWTKSQVIREAIWAVARAKGLVRRPAKKNQS
jgi:hypothetical protein